MYRIVYILSVLLVLASCSSNKRTAFSDAYSSKNKRVAVHAAKKKSNYRQTNTSAEHKPEGLGKKSADTENYTRNLIINDALAFIGTRYLPGGRKPETGFDCSGFTSFVFTKNNIPLQGPSDKQATLGKQKAKDELAPGDLVFFGSKQRISHVAIVVRNGTETLEVVHATTSAGVKKDEVNLSKYWNQRFLFGMDIISGYLDTNSAVSMK
jgi:cell wall-associated NlpC family hydrolase